MDYLTSSFSLQMVSDGATIKVRKGSLYNIVERAEYPRPDGKYNTGLRKFNLVAIGHQGTCDWLAGQCEEAIFEDGLKLLHKGFGVEQVKAAGWENISGHIGGQWRRIDHLKIEVNRASIQLQPGDEVVVIQPINNRLTPGTELTGEQQYQVFVVSIYTANSVIETPEWHQAANDAMWKISDAVE
jgi:hypothetical protein